jgi:hypothetical protein
MRKFLLIKICLCVSVVLFSQQAFAFLVDMTPSEFASAVEQTGTWSINSGTSNYQSASWPNPMVNSWSTTPVSSGTHTVVVTGTYPHQIYTNTYTGGIGGTTHFNYEGDEYYFSSPCTGTFIYDVTFNGTIWELNPSSSMNITSTTSAPIPIYLASDNSFTGFYMNNAGMTGTITSYNWQTEVNAIAGGEITSATGSITGSAVPIPAALWLFGSGVLGFVGLKRKVIC